MTVFNREAERKRNAIPSILTIHDLGKAMAQLDLSGVPPDKRYLAIREHLGRIMHETTPDKTKTSPLILPRNLRY